MNHFYPGTGTTICPHCGTRFRIDTEQLAAHQSLVRCGHCLQAFDTRPNFDPEEIDPQLELPILYEDDAQPELLFDGRPVSDAAAAPNVPVLLPLILSDQAVFIPTPGKTPPAKRHSWFWTAATFVLLLMMLAQSAYLLRADLSARLPALKPALVRYCLLLKCTVPLPKKASLMSIESSELKDDPAHRNQILLFAQLRNRAGYAQALPYLELTLTDSQDKAMARKSFAPEAYLPMAEELSVGLPANQEISVKLHLDTADLKPVGYRLMLYYPGNQLR